MQITTLVKIFFLTLLIVLAQHASAVIVIDSAQSTPSHCANDGTITIYGRSPSSMLYAIVSGPDIRPAQSGSRFSALPQGSYQVMVTNFSNDTAYISATVGGTYVFPDFSPTYRNPQCPYSSTGIITGNPTMGTGLLPYTWTLTNTNTGQTVTQASDTFSGLAPGDYSVRMYDSCQGFATRFVTLTDPGASFTLQQQVYHNMIGCDTDVMTIMLWPTHAFWAPPFIVDVYLSGVHKTDTLYPALTAADPFYIIYDTIPGVNLGAGGSVTVTNGCGESYYTYTNIDNWGAYVSFYPTTDSCIPVVGVSFSISNYFYTATSYHAPITFKVWDLTAGNMLIDSTVLHYNTGFYFPTYNLKPGHNYHLTIKDECGNFSEKYFTTPTPAPTSVSVARGVDACLDSTGTVNIHCYNYSTTSTTLTILSGPPTSHSTQPYFAHNDTIIYPATGFMINHCSGYSSNEVCYGVGGMGPGLYRFRVQDSCGHSYTDTFVIRDVDLSAYDFKRTAIRGCPGQNKIKYLIHRTINYTSQDFMRLYRLGSSQAIDSIVSDSATFSNLNAGTYVLEHQINRYHNYDQINASIPCNTIRDTIVILPYQLPRVDYATQIKCNGLVNVGLQPDSASGVPPYAYEILSGPQTASVQASNFFALSQPGTYVARISDTCGFARTFTFAVDTLSFQQIVKIGSSCVGNNALLISQHSPYATYIWRRPNGIRFTGDSLRINPVLAADYGIYQVMKVVRVNGCRDTFYTTYTLTGNTVANFSATICNGDSVAFGARYYSVAGIYSDTVSTGACDSISVMRIIVSGGIYDSISRTICAGQSYTVGTHVYSTTGIYHDTIAVAGCDTIRILDLHVTDFRRDSVVVSVCEGQAVTVGVHTYTNTGIYRDTFSTTGCDSIHILDLRVSGPLRDTLTRTICSGQSVTIAGHVYNATGIYRDTFASGSCGLIIMLDLRVGDANRDSVSQSICSGQSITVGTHVYSSTGIYRDTFTTTGCDSIHILNLSVGSSRSDSVSQNICTGQSISVGTHIYSATGIYRDTFTTAGCDSIHILNLSVGSSKRDSVSQSICSGQSITVGTHVYSNTGIYRDTFATVGCDSIHILNLSVGSFRRDSVSQSICSGQSITVGTHVYSSAGIYRDTFSTTGCDSIHILNLSVSSSRRDSVSQSICSGQSITVGIHVYNSTGIYRDTFATAGCDSVHILNLIVGSSKRDSVLRSICSGQSITVGIHVYNSTGIYRDTFATAGCDSIHILNLSVGGSKRDSVSQSICSGQSVTVGTHVYTSAGIYRDTFTTVGCDSIHILNLTIGEGKRDTVDVSFCEGQSISIGGTTYTQPGVYSDTFATGACDSIHSIRITVWPRPDIHIIADAVDVMRGDTVQLHGTGSGTQSYQWTSDAILSDSHIADPTAIITESTWVVLQAGSSNNCTSIDSLFIRIGDCEGTMFVPNAFSPNGDGINDTYHIYGRCVRLNSMMIFNRWGEKVWETDDMSSGWDGRYKGAMQPTEVYVYTLSYSLDSKGGAVSRHMQGSITLIR